MDSAVDRRHQEAYHHRQYGVDLSEDDYDVERREVPVVRAMNYMFDLDSIYHHQSVVMTLEIVGCKERNRHRHRKKLIRNEQVLYGDDNRDRLE
jgi:hypothetical protein